jgi:hypothetical protein
MSAPLLAAVTLAYLWVAIGYAREHRYGMTVAFLAYALANVGFILDLRR